MSKHPQTVFGRRLRAVREQIGLAQDRLGVLVGIDEGCSSARISRYETGTHEPPFGMAQNLAAALNVPVAYFYCVDEFEAELLLILSRLGKAQKRQLMTFAESLLDSQVS